jgi:ankyrin repeat protein
MSLKASFFTAAVIGDVKELKKLLKEINPNFRNKDGETPLHIVAGESRLEAVKLLLDHGADPNAQNKEGETPLHYAAEKCDVDVVKLLLQYGADPNARDDNGQTPLHRITDKSETIVLDETRRYYIKVRSALYFLLGKLGLVNYNGSCAEVVELLVKHGADPNAKDKHGETPLDYAITYEYVHYIALLAKYGANWIYEERPIDMINCDLLSDELKPADVIRLTELVVGRDALSLLEAAGRGDVEEVKRMLIRVDPNTRDICGRAPLHYAAREGRVEAIKLLLERGAYPNAWDNGDKTSLHYAAERGDVEIVRLLLEKGAYPNARDYRRRTPLRYAAEYGYSDIVRLLLEHGTLSLFDAVTKGDVEGVKLWLERGVDPNVKVGGSTPLHVAAERGYVEIVELLLSEVGRGVEVDARDGRGFTPLQYACFGLLHAGPVSVGRYRDVVVALLRRGADPDVRDEEGNTVLHWAASRGHGWVVDLLVRYGADLYAKNKRGRTPLDVAVGEAKTVLREWARRFKGEAPPPSRGYIEIEPLDEVDGRGGADRK